MLTTPTELCLCARDFADGKHQLLVAQVLCGNVKDYGQKKERNLKFPPEMPGSHQMFDSVQVLRSFGPCVRLPCHFPTTVRTWSSPYR